MKGKERLAESGYYVSGLIDSNGDFDNSKSFHDKMMKVGGIGIRPVYISPEGKCQYIYDDCDGLYGYDWDTLGWTSAPTKKKSDIVTPSKSSDSKEERFEKFDSIDAINARYGSTFAKCPLEV